MACQSLAVKHAYKRIKLVFVCASVPTCLVGMRTVHYDVRLWRGCSILRHISVNRFFLAKENTLFRKEGNDAPDINRRTATAESENAVSNGCTNLHSCNYMYTHTLADGKEDRFYLHQLVPVLNGFPGICQHGCPVLSAGAFSITSYTAHPNHLVMANTDGDRGTKKKTEFIKWTENRDKGGQRHIIVTNLLNYSEKY